MEPEVLFLRYAVPCAFQLVMSHKLTPRGRDELEQAAIEGRKIERARLERTFPKAIIRMARYYAGERDIWNFVGHYFRKIHNTIIAATNQPDDIKDLCMVHEAEVVSLESGLMVVKYSGSLLLPKEYRGERIRRGVKSVFVPQAKIRDRVTIHWKYAVELVDEKE